MRTFSFFVRLSEIILNSEIGISMMKRKKIIQCLCECKNIHSIQVVCDPPYPGEWNNLKRRRRKNKIHNFLLCFLCQSSIFRTDCSPSCSDFVSSYFFFFSITLSTISKCIFVEEKFFFQNKKYLSIVCTRNKTWSSLNDCCFFFLSFRMFGGFGTESDENSIFFFFLFSFIM